MQENTGDIILYQAEDGTTSLEVHLKDDTVWLTQTVPGKLRETDSFNRIRINTDAPKRTTISRST